MPIPDRRYTTMPAEYHVPRLGLDVMHSPRHHDVTPRRAYTDRDHYYRRSRSDRPYVRGEMLSTRDTTYGIDRDFVHDYYFDAVGEFAEARVQLYSHDSSDPYSCTCYPRVSNKTIPSMMYDEVRCPHPQHRYQPAEQDVFAYPWTSQTYRPKTVNQQIREHLPVKPTSVLTAPPGVYNNAKDRDNPGKRGKPPPYSAPEIPAYTPLLSARALDHRFRRVRGRQLAALPNLAPVKEEVSPFDSVSQVAPRRSFRPPSLRLRTVDSHVRRRVDLELRSNPGVRALSTPRARSVLDLDGFPETPTRIFKGEYVGTSGQRYQYDIKYGKNSLAGKRTRLNTV